MKNIFIGLGPFLGLAAYCNLEIGMKDLKK